MIIGIFCFTAPVAFAAEFRDLPRNYTFYDEVRYLSDKGIISGYPDDMFRATAHVTRAEAAIMIGRALELNGNAKNTTFRDVTAKVTGSGYIASAVEKGIITGYPNGTYRPHEPVTRGQIAIFLDRAFELEPCKCANPFIDISSGQVAFQSIMSAHWNGIANGYSDGTYRPDTAVTRGQFSAFMARALEPSFRGAPAAFAVESISGWEPGGATAEVDMDHDWVIKFTDTVDKNSIKDHITIERERDHKQHYYEIQSIDPKTIKLKLYDLYHLDETYSLSISKEIKSKMGGEPLAEPLIIKFHINNSDFKVKKTLEQDGIRMEVQLAQSGEKIFAKLKATNISNEDIPYTGFSGCDPGISANLFSEAAPEPNRVGSKWGSAAKCTLALVDYVLKPGDSVEAIEVLYPPRQQVHEDLFIKAEFHKGRYQNNSPIKSIEVSIPLEELKNTN